MFITEALAELKTIEKRVAKKRDFIIKYAVRMDSLRDPFEKDGGSFTKVAQEIQGVGDLLTRYATIRTSIQKVNLENSITVCGVTKTIAEWLVWKRDLAHDEQIFTNKLAKTIVDSRAVALANAPKLKDLQDSTGKPVDIVVNVNESVLNTGLEGLEEIIGSLDGQLSLKNATLTIDVL